MIELSLRPLRLLICEPGEYYQGTRFDRAGIFRRIEKNGYVFADEWFSHCDPFRHDRVCGLSEEFVTVDFAGTEPGGLFCKPGVGLLRRPDEAPYDWFRLYEIAEPGIWDVKAGPTEAVFTHRLPGLYNYTKRISLLEDSGLEIDFVSKVKSNISLIEVKATTGNTKSANTVLKNPQYDVDVCYKLSENNVGVVDKKITIPYYMAMFL